MTNLIDALHIPDTQSARDDRRLAIQRVGVRGVRYPIQLRIEGAVVPTVADWSLDVALPAEQKGTHMSRFVAWLDAIDDPLDVATLKREAARMLALLGADAGRIEASFPFFLRKRAPVSGVESLLEYQGRFVVDAEKGQSAVWVEVVVPVKSLCPCSKEISDYGAHNQRSHVTIRVEALAAARIEIPVLTLGLPDEFSEHGDPAKLLSLYGLDGPGIEQSVQRRFGAVPAAKPARVRSVAGV